MSYCLCGAATQNALSVSAASAAVLHEGRLLFEKNADRRMPMASTTKIMTAILAMENCGEEEIVPIKPEYCAVEGSSMYLKPGTEKTVGELLKGLMLVSGNDAALALADHVAGDMGRFTDLMNRKAKALGLINTCFANPHGLSHSSHYSSAHDLAILMDYCMDNELFRRIAGMKSFENDGAQLSNHNKLLFCCPGCIAGKTGYTMAAGRCLVSCCEREGTRLICVTLDAPDDWNDHMALYNWAYNSHSMRSVTENVRFSVPIIRDEGGKAYLVPEVDKSLFLRDEAEIILKAETPWFVFRPISQGERGGRVSIFVDGNKAGEYYLIYSEDYN